MHKVGSARPGLGGRGRATRTWAVVSGHDNSSTFFRAAGKVVGRLRDGWLVKRVDRRRHMLQVPPSWCCDTDHLEQLERLGARGVRLRDEQGRVWTAMLWQFEAEGFRINRGYGEQVALPLGLWSVEDGRQLRLLEAGAGG